MLLRDRQHGSKITKWATNKRYTARILTLWSLESILTPSQQLRAISWREIIETGCGTNEGKMICDLMPPAHGFEGNTFESVPGAPVTPEFPPLTSKHLKLRELASGEELL